jgi:hypothetical protein
MSQDLREMFRNEEGPASEKLSEGHEKRFEAKLDKALPIEKSNSNYLFLKIAAVLIVVFGVGFIFFTPSGNHGNLKDEIVETPVEEVVEEKELETQFQVSDVSPEFRKIENYYLASLNFEIAKLEVTEENKALLDAFMKQLAELEKEYKRLNNEFSEIGANEQTVEALIVNLQLRLELLYKVKNKIKEIKESKNEQHENYQV